MTEQNETTLLQKCEILWDALQENKLGGYSGINRPFYIKWKIEDMLKEEYLRGFSDGQEASNNDKAN